MCLYLSIFYPKFEWLHCSIAQFICSYCWLSSSYQKYTVLWQSIQCKEVTDVVCELYCTGCSVSALIAEVTLYSEGFESSKILASKMTRLYQLCSELLSQQDHYDFGMRFVFIFFVEVIVTRLNKIIKL